MSTIDVEDEELFADLQKVVDSIKNKAISLVTQGTLRRNQHIRSKKLRRMSTTDKEFVLQRTRGFKVYREDGQPVHQIIWSERRQLFKVKQAR